MACPLPFRDVALPFLVVPMACRWSGQDSTVSSSAAKGVHIHPSTTAERFCPLAVSRQENTVPENTTVEMLCPKACNVRAHAALSPTVAAFSLC